MGRRHFRGNNNTSFSCSRNACDTQHTSRRLRFCRVLIVLVFFLLLLLLLLLLLMLLLIRLLRRRLLFLPLLLLWLIPSRW
jgi:hypothetical protein